MKDPLLKYINKLLENPEVMICIANGVEYELESINDNAGFPIAIKFKTKNKIKFVKNKSGTVIEIRELKNENDK